VAVDPIYIRAVTNDICLVEARDRLLGYHDGIARGDSNLDKLDGK
jgi:hypothetical protein